ncbi:MAG: DUF4173 domain-containing protein [Pseudomonadota bacterium]
MSDSELVGAPSGSGAANGEGHPWRGVGPLTKRLFGLVVIVFVGDVLFWEQRLGASVPLFATVLGVVSAVANGNGGHRVLACVIMVAGCLPALDYLQPLSVVIMLAGTVLSLSVLHAPMRTPWLKVCASAWARIAALPVAGLRDLWLGGRAVAMPTSAKIGRQSRDWAFPAGGAAVLLGLLTEANPIFASWLWGILDIDVDPQRLLGRILLWAGLGLLVWPLLVPAAPGASAPALPGMPFFTRIGLNPTSVARALIVFNLILASQTLSDGVVLWGEQGLPAGMSYAEYAHRGAYPLLATALLAGAFALAARPFLGERNWLTWLMMIWLGQNVLLCASTAFRLALYVDAYGLTYLRVYVIMWVPLVAAGLVLIAVQIWAGFSKFWLILRSTALGIALLYATSFVNVAALIAEHNLARADKIDWAYVCDLPDTAAAAIRPHLPARQSRSCGRFEAIEGWRDWSFRRWLVARRLQAVE